MVEFVLNYGSGAMKGFGVFVLIAGTCWLVFALSMDVSVETGAGGRVNNLGLMADRQVHAIVGGMMALAGLLMTLFGGKSLPTQAQDRTQDQAESRACPMCAETIKNAAVKCKHCGADVEAVAAPRLKNGWVASVPCKEGSDQDRTIDAISALGLPVVPMIGASIGAGPFATKEEAKQAVALLRNEPKIFSEIIYRDSVSGEFPPVTD